MLCPLSVVLRNLCQHGHCQTRYTRYQYDTVLVDRAGQLAEQKGVAEQSIAGLWSYDRSRPQRGEASFNVV